MRVAIASLISASAAVLVACGTPPAVMSHDQGQFVAQSTLRSIVETFNRADGEAYGANYWPEAELVGFDGSIIDGREAIIHNHLEMWEGPLKGARISGAVRKVRVLSPTSILADVNLSPEGSGNASPARLKRTKANTATIPSGGCPTGW